jgi:hypothetical protein
MSDQPLPSSGNQRSWKSGARRDSNKGKIRPDLQSPLVEYRLGLLLSKGVGYYGYRNWETGIPDSAFYESLRRHILQWLVSPPDNDDHLAAAVFNACGLLHNDEAILRGWLSPNLHDLRYPHVIQGHSASPPAPPVISTKPPMRIVELQAPAAPYPHPGKIKDVEAKIGPPNLGAYLLPENDPCVSPNAGIPESSLAANPFLTTHSGRTYHYLDPKPEEVCLDDITWALSNTPRFGGYLSCHWTITDHTYLCLNLLESPDLVALTPDSPINRAAIRLLTLLHDAAEAYTGDLPRPLKTAIRALVPGADPISIITARANTAIHSHLQLPPLSAMRQDYLHPVEFRGEAFPHVIRLVDHIAAVTEAVALFPVGAGAADIYDTRFDAGDWPNIRNLLKEAPYRPGMPPNEELKRSIEHAVAAFKGALIGPIGARQGA